ncbi:DsbA family protein [Paenibacillus sp. CF384]|uniref:DsbA family protein n=1 Tax=Paenibacillus sp. CF384 TaxID=1884382 RepID=UPI000898EB46|nr:DsbA family protein [Paenibacillus sp. CF384]SDW29039.1 Protein-disulfide isomerase [Paenibacillus sp. CF384]
MAKKSKPTPSRKGNGPSSKQLVLFTLLIVGLFVLMFVINQAADKTGDSFEHAPVISNQPIEGNKDAKVSIIEFGDYKCPSCKAWGEQLYPKLKEAYMDNGKANFSYINVLFHGDESKLGAQAGEAVWSQNPEAFWSFHKALFQAQPSQDHDALWITTDKIKEIAATIKPAIDLDKLIAAMSSETVQNEVSSDEKLVQEYRVTQTPSIMINQVMVKDPFDYAAIVELIEKQLNE